MIWLAVAALIWIGAHVGIAGSGLRRALAYRLGETGFRGAFSLVSFLAIAFLIASFSQAPLVPLWVAPDWLRWALVAVMLAAFLLFATAVLARNPTAIGGDAALRQEPRGVVRVTRHPMLWSFALWAAVHVLGNGDVASLLFFGAFLLIALAGMPSIAAKVARRDPEGWRHFAAATSILPFGAIASGRNRFAPAEIGWAPVALGAALWAVLLLGAPPDFRPERAAERLGPREGHGDCGARAPVRKFATKSSGAPMSKPLGLALAAALLAPASVIAAPPPTVVFFTEWSARIDDAARRAIGAAAERAKQDGAKELTVTGYADTTGSKEANALLSATRAQVVTDQLVADGVPASHIHQAAKGATDFIQTSLESRRVVISIAEP